MSLATYSDLQAALQSYAARTDLSANVPDFISMFEAEANRVLRVPAQMVTATVTTTSGSGSLPADFLEQKRVTWNGSPLRELEYVDPEWLVMAYPTTPSNLPNVYTIEGSTIKIRPVDDTGLTLAYWQKIPALSNSNTTNWLMTAHPGAYLSGAMFELKYFIEDFQGAAVWQARRDDILAKIRLLGRASKTGLAIRSTGPVI